MRSHKIIWSDEAKKALKSIFDYYKSKSVKGANILKTELLQAPKTIHFSKQYQVDDVNPDFRRIVVRDYKILYLVSGEVIEIIDVISSKQSRR